MVPTRKKIRHYEKNKNTHNKLVPLFVTTANGGKKTALRAFCCRAQLGREEQQEQDHGPAGIITTTTTVTTTTALHARWGPADQQKQQVEREREREVPCETLLVWSRLESVCRRLPLFVVFARSSLSGSAQKQSTRFHTVS
jgi:hypothetical protein